MTQRLPRTILVILVLALAATLVDAADPYSEGLMRRGLVQLDAGDAGQAAELLRLACFGLLNTPPVLAECLVPLALAYDQLGQDEEFRAVFERVVEVEDGFHAYSESALDPTRRAAFEAAVKRHIPQEVLASIEGFARLVPTEEERIAAMSPSERRRYFEDRAEAEPSEPRWPLELARMDLSDGRDRRARRHLEEALARQPDHTGAQLELARLEAAEEHWSEAVMWFQASGRAAEAPRDAELLLTGLIKLDRFDEASEFGASLDASVAAEARVAALLERAAAEVERQRVAAEQAAALEAAEAEAAAAAEAEAETGTDPAPALVADEQLEQGEETPGPGGEDTGPGGQPTEAADEAPGPGVQPDDSSDQPGDSSDAVSEPGDRSTEPDETQPTPAGPAGEDLERIRVVDEPTPTVPDQPADPGAGDPEGSPGESRPAELLPAEVLQDVRVQELRDRTVVTLTFDRRVFRDTVAHWRLADPPRHMVVIQGVGEKRVPYRIEQGGPRVLAVRSAVHGEKDPVETHVVFDRASVDVEVSSVRVAGRVLIVELTGE